MGEYYVLVFQSKKTKRVMKFGPYDTLTQALNDIRTYEKLGYTYLEYEKKLDDYINEKYEKAVTLMNEGYSKKEAAKLAEVHLSSFTHYLKKTGRQTTA